MLNAIILNSMGNFCSRERVRSDLLTCLYIDAIFLLATTTDLTVIEFLQNETVRDRSLFCYFFSRD